jgi:hypothetical protein
VKILIDKIVTRPLPSPSHLLALRLSEALINESYNRDSAERPGGSDESCQKTEYH